MNALGFGARRSTSPPYLAPPIQKPGSPRSIFHEKGPPVIRKFSETSVIVLIGPPTFDGGSQLSSFVVEWDLDPSFNNPIDGIRRGRVTTAASRELCQSCLIAFDVDRNSFTHTQGANITKHLRPQRKIFVFFTDDMIYLTSVSSTDIFVRPYYLRSSSAFSFALSGSNNTNSTVGGPLLVMGSDVVIKINLLVNGTFSECRRKAPNWEQVHQYRPNQQVCILSPYRR